ncbi:cyclopropane-fatty-acyl-phospholipid synthase family protein [Streptomyces avidinii]|uniref:class I SAM-dependent methyltransferase n=1 Tax=Streptomyces avidinii TaxID=1895 RepID=UPI00386E1FA9|nr:cyclopropane-fatty-acyl-phospholipid synthase family protein [Streptomyces avidinii]
MTEAASTPALRETMTKGIAGRVAALSRTLFGADLPVGLRVWDGSSAGPQDGPVLVLRSPGAVRHLLRSPGERGLSRAYVTGEIDVEGDFRQALRECLDYVRTVRRTGARRPGALPALSSLLSLGVRLGALGLPPKPPAEEAGLTGRAHTRMRDRAAIAHHYDLGNEFYRTILDETMAYSCGLWTSDAPEYRPADAQRDKLDLICRKLDLRPGSRLLDIGCGWGSLVVHAAERHAARTTGITNSARQYEYITARLAERGLANEVEVRLQDYRQSTGDSYDAVSSVEMGEHVGEDNYPAYCAMLHRSLRPGGRLLLQQMSRGGAKPGGGAFVESYIAPDMTMRPLPATLAHLEKAGFEIRDVQSLREHYVRTIDAWSERLETSWEEVVYRFGARRARIWRLYLAGASLAFEGNRMSVHQILAVRTRPDGGSGFPSVADRSGVNWAPSGALGPEAER